MEDNMQAPGRTDAWPFWAIRIVLAMLALGLFAFALWGALDLSVFRRVECWWLMVAAVALFGVALTLGTAWQTAGLTAATFLVGFGAQLAVREPTWFQNVRFRSDVFSMAMMGGVLAQSAVATLVLFKHRALAEAPRVLRDLGFLRVAIFLAILVIAAKGAMGFVATENYPRLVKHVVIGSAFIGINLASFLAIMMSLPAHRLRDVSQRVARNLSLPGSGDQVRRLDRAVPICGAVFVLLMSLLVSLAALEGVPHLDDILYQFHARYLADGLLTLPVPPSTQAFDHYLMDTYQGRWFVTTFPGWAAALALGVKLGAPWLVNPVLAGISVLLLHVFVRKMTDRGTANLVVLLMAVSPWIISMAATQLIHTFTYALVLGAWVLLLKAREAPSVIFSFVAGALMGWLLMTRPLEGLFMGVLTGLWTLTFLADRRHWRTVLAYGLGCIIVGGLIFPYNAYLTGDPLTTPLNAYYDEYWGPGSNALGFGPDIGAPDWGNVDVFPGHSPLEGLINSQQNLYELNFSLLGWGGASLAFALFFVLWGRWSRFAGAMALIVVTTIFLYALFWFYGGYFAGPRYWFMTSVPLLILTALGITTATRRFSQLYPDGLAPQRIGAGVAFLSLCSVLVFESWLGFNRYPEINGYHDEYETLARQDAYRNSLMFISTDADREYGSAFWLNDFTAGADSPLFALDLGPESNRAVAAAYPGRAIYFLKGRSSDQDHVVVTRGPISAAELARP
ncbi:MAG: hypothetical protein Tsb0024_04800 [Ruegeria sp.]